jgi:hypothetical protein
MNARYYASMQGRFSSVDPVFMMVDRQYDPQQINLYAYCRNNPLAFTDPTGMILDPNTWDKDARRAFQDYMKLLNSDTKKYASELATIKQLEQSSVNYVVKLDQGGSDFSGGKEGNVTTNGTDVFINVADQGNGREKFSLNSRLGHELEHARQFDSGEWGFVSDKNGRFMDKNGKYIGSFVGVDITDEVKAWSVGARLASTTDFTVMGGSSMPEFQFRVLDTFNKAATDADKAAVLSKLGKTYSDDYKRGTSAVNSPSLGQPIGTLIRPSSPSAAVTDQNGVTRRFFGRTH